LIYVYEVIVETVRIFVGKERKR